jgi:hypothetical protein
MAGIFFSGGLTCNLTVNAACGIQTTGDDCPALYYPPKCNVQVDPLQMNAVISEIANAINAFGKQYDCSRLDNLKQVLNRARNICDLPAFGDAPDMDDRIAGCFDNNSSTITVQQLVNLVLSQAGTLCNLPQIGDIQDDDWLAGCIDGAARIVPFTAVKAALGGGSATALVAGEQIYNSYATSGGHNVSMPTENREAMIAEMYYEPAGGGVVGDGQINVATGGGQFQSVLLKSNWPMQVDPATSLATLARPARLFANVIKKNGVWFMLVDMKAIPLGGDDGVLRFTGGRYATLTIWNASKF